MNNLNEKIQQRFNTYQSELFLCLINFIKSIELEDEFNFTYLDLYLLITKHEEKFHNNLKKQSYNYWFFDDFNNQPPKGVFGNWGLKNDEIQTLEKQSILEFTSMHEIWIKKMEHDYLNFFKTKKFSLMISEYDVKLVKGKKNREIALAYNGIFNTEGWLNFLSAIFKAELSDFELEVGHNMLCMYKNINDYKVEIRIEPNDIINVNELLKSYGVFYFGIVLSIEFFQNKIYKLYPPELSALLSESFFKKYSIEFKNASYEESKMRVYANVKAYCNLIKLLLPNLENLLIYKD